MNARFLRDEAARFRGMAETTDRLATKERFLAMAADYEARAEIAKGVELKTNETVEPSLGEPTTGLADPSLGETLKVEPVRQIAKSLKETIVVERRPVGRPRRE
jgi:hypothetical protein